MSSKNVLVTGASSGLGLNCSIELAAQGARLLLACRPGEKAHSALEQVASAASGPAPQLVDVDLADLASVRKASGDIGDLVDRLDIVMLNAGVMAMPRTRTSDGFETHFGVNHLAHFVLMSELMPIVMATPGARVVSVASLAHRWGRIRWTDPNWRGRLYSASLAYGQSKLANLLFMRELARRGEAAGLELTAAGAHPGSTRTNLADHHTHPVSRLAYRLLREGTTQDVSQGIRPLMHAALASDVPNGSYWGPDGRLELHGAATKPGHLSRRARDDDAARRLWSLSNELTGASWPQPFDR